MCRLVGIPQRQGKSCPGMSIVGRAELRRGRRGTAKTHEYDTSVLMKGRRCTAKLDGCVISRECLLVSRQISEHEAKSGIVAGAGFARDSFVFSEHAVPLCCLLPLCSLRRAFRRLREPLRRMSRRQVIGFHKERLCSFRIAARVFYIAQAFEVACSSFGR